MGLWPGAACAGTASTGCSTGYATGAGNRLSTDGVRSATQRFLAAPEGSRVQEHARRLGIARLNGVDDYRSTGGVVLDWAYAIGAPPGCEDGGAFWHTLGTIGGFQHSAQAATPRFYRVDPRPTINGAPVNDVSHPVGPTNYFPPPLTGPFPSRPDYTLPNKPWPFRPALTLPNNIPLLPAVPVVAPGAPKPTPATAADYLKPKPNTLYASNGYLYRTDAEGRLVEASGQLRLNTAPRNSYRQTQVGKSSGVAGDEGGHMIGTQFDGLGEGPLHMVPQAMRLNRGAGSKWTAMERKWADALGRGDKVSVKVEVEWAAGTKRPDGFTVKYEITDAKTGLRTPVEEYFPNP